MTTTSLITRSPSLRVLFIGGFSRSGSTLLEHLLDQSPDMAAFGEIHTLFARYDVRSQIDKRQYCSCQARFCDCPFWTSVMTRLFGSMTAYQPKDLYARFAPYASPREARVAALLGKTTPEWEFGSNAAAANLREYYEAIAQVAGVRVLIDSSKINVYGALLARMPDTDFRFLHLVRHSAACAQSWRRVKKRPEVHWEDRYMRNLNAFQVGRAWHRRQMDALKLAKISSIYKQLNYEDFVCNSEAGLADIAAFVGLPAESVAGIVTNRRARIEPGHSIMGNPDLMTQDVEIRLDDEWKRKLKGPSRLLVEALTLNTRRHLTRAAR